MIEVVLLAIVQGIAEFLPISSSGHLVIVGSLLGEIDEEPTLEILLHAGTLGSILVVFWRRILDLVTSDRRVIPLLIVGTIPAAVAGIVIKTQFQNVLRSPLLAGCMLLVTAAMLIVLGRLRDGDRAPAADEEVLLAAGEAEDSAVNSPSDRCDYRTMSIASAFVVGLFQAFAILPGISRSGSTILGGRWMGLRRDDALTMSFLLAIPAIGGAAVLALKDLKEQLESQSAMKYSVAELSIGTAIAFFVGIAALRWLIRWNQADRLSWFAWWCAPMGILVMILHFMGRV